MDGNINGNGGTVSPAQASPNERSPKAGSGNEKKNKRPSIFRRFWRWFVKGPEVKAATHNRRIRVTLVVILLLLAGIAVRFAYL